jgi:hypothetical protein
MQARAFLDLARQMVLGKTEAHWRAAVIHGYYAVLLEGREALARWGRPLPPKENVHSYVRLTMTFATDPDVKFIGGILDDLVKLRNKASYELQAAPYFTTDKVAQVCIRDASNAITLIDAIDSDPVRRTATIASLPPPPP